MPGFSRFERDLKLRRPFAVAGHGFAARIDVRTKGDKQSVTMQSVTIRPHSGTDVASLSVVLHR
jgi:hypothetical protein